MRRSSVSSALLTTLVALALYSSSSSAAGFDLRWDACAADGGVSNKNFACDTDDGEHTMVASFTLDQPITGLFYVEAVLDLIVAGSQPVPVWWDFNNCRLFAMTADANYDPAAVNCSDWSGGLGAGVMSGYHSGGSIASGDSASHRRMTVICGVDPSVNVSQNQDYFLFNLVLVNSYTVDPGACAGCTVPVCIVLNSIRFFDATFQNITTLATPVAPGSNYAVWQGGVGANCSAVPAKKATWAAVKSLYR